MNVGVNLWLRFQPTLQFRRRVFDFGVTMLASSGFCRKQPAAMNIFEIAVRKFVSALRILRVAIIDPEMPLCIFTESVHTDELILFVC